MEINQDQGFLKKAWTVQRVGWVVMVLLLLAALVGLLGGGGPLSQATAGAASDPLQIEYQRLARHQTPTELRLALGPTAARDGVFRVWLARGFLQQMQITSITPTPERVETSEDRLVYEFPAAGGVSSTGVTFFVEPNQIGSLRGQAGLPDGPTLSLNVFVYP
jgi:hypothetical protein